MMKYLIYSVLALCFSASLVARAEKLDLSVNAEAAILINAESGAILYEKNAHVLHYPASTTKIATAIYALQEASDHLDVMIAADQECIGTVTEEALRRSNYTMPAYLLIPDGSHIGIKRGEVLSLRDLLYGLMVASGDDAANVIAKYVGGTIPKFVQEMNAYAQKAGCRSTTFYNPHGLHHPKQLTTAYDMAILTREALKNPIFREIVATVRYTRPKTNKQEASTLIQTNHLLRNGPYSYPKAIGVKTGYYSLAGHNLVAAAKDGDRTLIAVLLKGERKETFRDAKKLFEAAFSQPKVQRTLLRKGPQKFVMELPGAQKPIKSYTKEDTALQYYPAEEPEIKCLLVWDQNVQLPVAKDQLLGELVLKFGDGQTFQSVPLYAVEDVTASLAFRLSSFGWFKLLGILAVFLFLGIVVAKRIIPPSS